MTNLQFASAICFAILIAIIHTRIHQSWAAHVRRLAEKNLEIYRTQLEDARAKLEVLKKLNEEHKLIVDRWSKGSDDYIRFCNEVISNCNGAEKTIIKYLKEDHYRFTKHASMHLKRFMSHLDRSIHEMDELAKKAK